jgi:hypothetical protein
MGKRVYVKNAPQEPVKEGSNPPDFRYSNDVKYDAVNLYMRTGNLKDVERELKVPYITLKYWKKSAWWDEFQRAIRGEKDIVISQRVEYMLDKAFRQMEKRIDDGDAHYNPNTGEMVQVPVKAQVLNAITANLHKQRIELANQPTEHPTHDKVATAAKLKELASAFTAFVKGKTVKEVDANEYEVLTDGTIIDGNGDIVDPDRITNVDKEDVVTNN